MKKVTNEDIILINEAYLKCKTYSGAAKITGWSPTTVKKYVIENYQSKNNSVIESVIELPPVYEVVNFLKTHKKILCLSPEEEVETSMLQKDLLI